MRSLPEEPGLAGGEGGLDDVGAVFVDFGVDERRFRREVFGGEERGLGERVEQAGVGFEIVADGVDEQRLRVHPRFIPVDVGQPHADQDGADVLVLELDGAVGAAVEERAETAAVLGFAEGLVAQLLREHREVVRDDQGDFGGRPVGRGHAMA